MSNLSTVLDRQSWEWLQEENLDAANALVTDVDSGKDPATIRRETLATVGETRIGIVNRVESAARHLVRQREARRN